MASETTDSALLKLNRRYCSPLAVDEENSVPGAVATPQSTMSERATWAAKSASAYPVRPVRLQYSAGMI